MAERSDYGLGSIQIVTFDPSVGTEIRKIRRALVISGTVFNAQRSKTKTLRYSALTESVPLRLKTRSYEILY